MAGDGCVKYPDYDSSSWSRLRWTGSIFQQAGLPDILGSVVIVVVCGVLNFKGEKIIEKFETIGTVLLYLGYILFTILVLVNKGGNIWKVFSTMSTSAYDGHVTVGLCIWTGILYCIQYSDHPDQYVFFETSDEEKKRH